MKSSKTPSKSRFIFPNEGLDYEFLDSGNQRKLERFGSMILNRPEVSAHWKPNLSKKTWEGSHWYFYEEKGKKGVWKPGKPAEKTWTIKYQIDDIKLEFNLELTSFKHIGIFPEQAANWQFIHKNVSKIKEQSPKVLNLFAYTGASSIVAAASGAKVTNVDSVKQVLNWAKKNAATNEEEDIRWILEDARKFVEKCIRRKEQFHGIILDPPSFGYGSKKETWKLERDLKALLEDCMKILVPHKSFLVLNTYSPKLDMLALKKMLSNCRGFPNHFETASLGLKSSSRQELRLGDLIRFSY